MVKKLTPLRWAIFGRVGSMALLSILLVGAIAHFYIQWSTLNTVKRASQVAVEEIAKSIESQLKAPLASLRQTSLLLQASDVPPANAQPLLQSAIQDSDSLEALLLLDEHGIVQGAVMRPELSASVADMLKTDLSRHPAFALSRATTQPTWSPVAHSPWTGARTISVCYHAGKLSLLGVLSIDPLQSMIRASAANHAHAVAVIDAAGNVSFQSQPDPENLPLDLLRTRLVREGLAGRSGTTILRVEGNQYIASAAPISSCGWITIITTPTSAVRTQVWTIDLIFGSLALMTCALMASASLNLGSLLDGSLRTMRDLSTSVARGQADATLPSQPYLELEHLAYDLREMASAIRQRDQKHRATEQILTLASKGAAATTGRSFFNELVDILAAATRSRCVLAAEWVPSPKPRARILAARASVPLENEFTYELSGNPCALLREKPIVHRPDGVSAEYFESPVMRLLGAEGYIGLPLRLSDGTVAGHFAIIDDHSLPLDDDMQQLLQVLASRGGAELERLQLERRLKESDAYHRAVLQSQPDLLCRSTLDGTLTFVNDAYCRYFGKKREDLIGRSFLTEVSDDERERLYAHFAKLTPGNVGVIELRVQLSTGEVRWHEWTNRPLSDAKGRVIEYQGTGRDITDRRKAEAQQAEGERRLRQIAESIGSVLWLIDWTTQKVLYCSPAFAAIWQIPLESLAENSMAWTITIHEEDRARVARRYLVGAAEGQYHEQYRIVRPDGSLRWIRDRRFPIRNAEGQVYRVAGISEDITDQLAPKEELITTPTTT